MGSFGCIFICLSAGAVEWESSCFTTTLWHHVPANVISGPVLVIIFGGLLNVLMYW